MATVEVSRETLAEDLKPMLEGRLDPEQVDAITASVRSAQTGYPANVNRLYSSTASFAFTATPVYVAVYFFDSDSNLLGNFQAGAVGTIVGTGGGPGSWS